MGMKIKLADLNKPVPELRKGLRLPDAKADFLAHQIALMRQHKKEK